MVETSTYSYIWAGELNWWIWGKESCTGDARDSQDSGQWALQSLSVGGKTMGRIEYPCLSSSRPGDMCPEIGFSLASPAKGHDNVSEVHKGSCENGAEGEGAMRR